MVASGFASAFQEDASLFAAIRRGWSQAAGCRCQSPFLDIRFDVNESQLPKVDVHPAGSIGANGWEEILRLEPVSNVFQFLSVARKEYRAGSWSIANSYNVAL
jgi:hypothetical protein